MSQVAADLELQTGAGSEAGLAVQNESLPPEVQPASLETLSAPQEDGEFAYRPITIWAPVSIFLGICGSAAMLTPIALSICLAAVLVALLGMWEIRRNEGEVGGKRLSQIGLSLGLLFLLGAGGMHGYEYATEVPEGYSRVSFNWLSNQGMVFENGIARPTEDVAKLDGQKIYIKGYMYPRQQRHGLKQFVLCKDNGDCCFGGQPKPTDMIAVEMQGGMSVELLEQQLVGVAGVFRASTQTTQGDLTAVYKLEGTHFR